MIYNEAIAIEVALALLKIKAVKLQPQNPFTWASGLVSPIYCDNRIILSYPEVRKQIAFYFASLVKEKFPETTLVAGVATGAIAHGMLVAESLNLPFAYVRSAPKGHGLGNMVEGKVEPGNQIVVIEDLISTGMSSLKAVDALREKQTIVLGMAAIFSYGFDEANQNFAASECKLFTLSNYETLLSQALATNYIEQSDLESLTAWRKNPTQWNK
jgi:orotate phosphoribosyltransferase